MADHNVLHIVRDTKVCTTCGIEKQFSEFYKSRRGKPRAGCKKCHAAAHKIYSEKNKARLAQHRKEWNIKNLEWILPKKKAYRDSMTAEDRSRRAEYNFWWKLNRKYGLTPEKWHEMLNAQGGTCAICRKRSMDASSGRLNVDHCHETGKVRGLLCRQCNTAIGILGDTPEKLERVLAYLRDDRDVSMIPRRVGAL